MYYKQNSCPNGTTPYTIKAGDTFYKIAKAQNISLDALVAANPGVNPDKLSIGQIVCIPIESTQPPTTMPCPTLRIGSRGPSVQHLQELLKNEGYNPGSIDGVFGPRTQTAVMAFQRDTHIAVDGIVGVQTWTALGVNCGTKPPRPPHTCPAGTSPYTIKAGDTLYHLAIKFNTTVNAIMAVNPGINPNALRIGQVICIPK